jgi:hypothetical protein
MSKVTRKLKVSLPPNTAKLETLQSLALSIRDLRTDVWNILVQRDNAAVSMYDFRTFMKVRGFDQHHYGVPQRVWRQNVEKTYREVRLWQEAAKENHKLKSRIYRRAGGNKAEERRLFTALKIGDWLTDPWLHKHTRRAFRAKPKPNRQKLRLSFDNGSYDVQRDQKTGLAWVSLLASTSGTRVRLCLGELPETLYPKGEIEVFFHADNDIQIHTGYEEYDVCAGGAIPAPKRGQSTHSKMREAKAARLAREAGSEAPVIESAAETKASAAVDGNKTYTLLGVDAGRTEVFIDSHGSIYGHGFGELCEATDRKRTKKNANRSKLRAHAKKLMQSAEKARATGDADKAASLVRKADNIYANNLGDERQTAAKERHKAWVRDLIFRSTHEVCKVADTIAHEKLSNSFSYNLGRKQNRLNSGWMRKILGEALVAVPRRRGSSAIPVNPAYTSQQVRACGHLGNRTNGSVYCAVEHCSEYKVKYHDDMDAAGSIEDRAVDPHITLSMTPKQVREVILSRYPVLRTG